MTTVGVDLGGTNALAVVLEDDDTVRARAKVATPTKGNRTRVIEVLARLVDDVLTEAGLDSNAVGAVGIGTPGVVIDGTVGGASNVPGFAERFDLASELSVAVGSPVRAVNDVTAAAVGEHRLGAARGADDVLAVFWGTGVGAGMVLGGRPFEGAHGGAGELGHVIVRQGGEVCPCGRRGCVEAYAGRHAMTLAAERAVAAGTPSILFEVMQERGKPRPTSGVFRDAFERGDRLTADLLDDAFSALAAGIASVVNVLDVEVVVLGGGLADKLGERGRLLLWTAMQPDLFLQPSRVELVGAELEDRGGAIGAALLARDIS